MSETWKPLKEYKNLYEVSNKGDIQSLNYNKTGKIRLMTPYEDFHGYFIVSLRKNNKTKVAKLHRLIAVTFIENPKNKRTINHKNGIKTDNRVCNLEWNTYSENIKHSYDKLSRKPAWSGVCGKEHPTSKSVLQIDLSGNVVKKWESMLQAEIQKGFLHQCISRCCKGQRKTYKGYKWSYQSIN